MPTSQCTKPNCTTPSLKPPSSKLDLVIMVRNWLTILSLANAKTIALTRSSAHNRRVQPTGIEPLSTERQICPPPAAPRSLLIMLCVFLFSADPSLELHPQSCHSFGAHHRRLQFHHAIAKSKQPRANVPVSHT